MKIVETNISYSFAGLEDHQSRVLEIPSWNEYCDLFRSYNGEHNGDNYKCVFNQMTGCVMPNNAEILYLKINDTRLTCNMKLYNECRQYKLAYILER